jgi:hypothetical protein
VPVKINLVTRDNGVGLSTDMALLESILTPAGHDVVRVPWRDPVMRPCDAAIYLELFNPQLARYARANIGVFNLEWFPSRWRPYLGRFRQLWAKSLEAYQTYGRWRLRNAHHTGFLTRDLLDASVPRELSCVHLAGHSTLKNTEAVLEAWRRAPDLPPLTLITSHDYAVPPGVRVLNGYVPPEQVVAELNRAQIHLCPSRAEGWGHYLTEALTAQAVVVTTDASPMNEHVLPAHGFLVPPAASGRRHFAADHAVDPAEIVRAVRSAAALPDGERLRMGEAARAHALARNARFTATALHLLGRI